MTRKPYLIVCDRSPYGSISFRESLDMATAAAAFDISVQLLLRGDGVCGALATQDSEGLGQKNSGKQLSALGIYGVDGVFAEGRALTQRSLTENDLLPDVKVLEESEVTTLFSSDFLIIQL